MKKHPCILHKILKENLFNLNLKNKTKQKIKDEEVQRSAVHFY